MAVTLAPTPRDTVLRDGTARLYRFRRSGEVTGEERGSYGASATYLPRGRGAPAEGGSGDPAVNPPGREVPLLLVPSMINRWYVLDLREEVSLARALVDRGIDTWCLDWGAPEDEDRFLTWDDVVARLHRMVRRVQRETGAAKVSLLGYCMGGTLSGIYTALEPDRVAALINLAGPFDFAEGGVLAHMTVPRWFDVDAIASAGNVHPLQMQSGFVAMRPTLQLAKWVGFFDRVHEPGAPEAFEALERWAGDNIAFPAEAYRTYIRELYQDNAIVRGTHRVAGRRVDLGAIACPTLTIAADRDTICPLPAARALHDRVGSEDRELLVVPGGHVGAVIGKRAPTELYPRIADWLWTRRTREEPS